MTGLLVYRAINAVAAELAQAGIAKTHCNEAQGYEYRSIDDVLNRLAPLLARHRLCVLPRVLRRTASQRRSEQGTSFTMALKHNIDTHTSELPSAALAKWAHHYRTVASICTIATINDRFAERNFRAPILNRFSSNPESLFVELKFAAQESLISWSSRLEPFQDRRC